MNRIDTVTTLLRVVIGITFIAHGRNHGWGKGGLDGTARWFASIGLQPARLHAMISAYMEVAAGIALVIGLFVPFAAAAGIGTMAVAFTTVHLKNGFFIIREGYEYVMVLATGLVVLSILGPGRLSLDHAFGIDLDGVWVGAAALVAGLLGAAGLLITSWRPPKPTS